MKLTGSSAEDLAATIQFEAFATYLMLLLFIALFAFISSIMVIGLKINSMIWDDAIVYGNLQKLGMTHGKIKRAFHDILVGGICGLVVILQLIIFVVLRSSAIKDNI